MLHGQVDLCCGRYILGWAFPRDSKTRCRIVVAGHDGRVIAKGIANEPRNDLASVGQGWIDFGFRVGVPLTDSKAPIHILADGVELPNSPVILDENGFDGEISVIDGIVRGWVTNRRLEPVTDPIMLLDQDGQNVLTVQPRLDPDEQDPFLRRSYFEALLPAACFGREELWLTARIRNTLFGQCRASCRLLGYLDRVADSNCAGWLFSPDAPGRSFEIEVYRDGVLVGADITRLPRADVSGPHPSAGLCGFDCPLVPVPEGHAALSHVSIRLAGSSHELFDGPFLFGSRAQAAADCYKATNQLQNATDGVPTLLREVIASWLRSLRTGPAELLVPTRSLPRQVDTARRLTIIVPVYGDVSATRICLESVLRTRRLGSDAVIIVNDNPAAAEIRELVEAQATQADVFALHNEENRGFIGSINRALGFTRIGDVLLLNSDTEVYPGTIDEMHRVLHAEPDIGTVTAMSNNATLFSYPHPDLLAQTLDDIGWAELAALALQDNAGRYAEIPTAHGFCMLIRRQTLDQVGMLDPAFGRGYGEENDFSIRASDQGWRHVLAGGAFVRHDEAGSFGAEKATLVQQNLALLASRYPEYIERIQIFEAEEAVRALRWPFDFHRLRRFLNGGRRLELVITNWLDGGTARAITDIAAVTRTSDVYALDLEGAVDGTITLSVEPLRLRAVFRPGDAEELFRLLATLAVERVVIHHLLGFDQDFVRALRQFVATRPSIVHGHDYYYACPRVTLLDATGAFCDGLAPDRCERCVELGGSHDAYRMEDIPAAEHRAIFQDLLSVTGPVIAPSRDTADRLRRLIPTASVVAVPHPQSGVVFPIGVRRGSMTDICLLGAIGPHKGADNLLALARYTRLHHPAFHFHVIGYTPFDDELTAIGNVTVTGPYEPDDLPDLVEATNARVALFLNNWPETFSYTLTEAVGLGLIPVVPDIGAPAERVRAAGLGVIYPFPVRTETVVATLLGLGDGSIPFNMDGARPIRYDTRDGHEQLRALYRGELATINSATIKPRRRRPHQQARVE